MRTIFLMRHGHAEARAPSGHDEDRELSDEGRRIVDGVAVSLREMKLVPASIWHSPFVRAQQTAERLHRCFSLPDPLVRPHLEPEASPALAAEALCDEAPDGVLVVSHLPLLPLVLQRLLGVPLSLDFPPASVAHLVLGPAGRVRSPATLMGLYRGKRLSRLQG